MHGDGHAIIKGAEAVEFDEFAILTHKAIGENTEGSPCLGNAGLISDIHELYKVLNLRAEIGRRRRHRFQ